VMAETVSREADRPNLTLRIPGMTGNPGTRRGPGVLYP
jgi:hypothetical protein